MTAEHHAAEPGRGQRPDGQIGPVGPVGQAGPESAPGRPPVARLPVGRLLAILLPALALLGMALATLLIARATEREREQMLAAMQGRADSLIWALEGGARFFGGRHGQPRLADLVAEVARQPGVAWIALTDAEGRILADSNAALVGSVLYSPDELRLLAPGSVPRGRFSPDEPGIYETWKAFAPGRLHGRRHGEAPQEQRCIFVALDATGFAERLSSYALGLALMAGVLILACLAFTALLVLAGRYRSSRRQLADAQALAAQVVREYPAGLVVLDNAGRALLCNARARAMLGMSAGRGSGQMSGRTGSARMSGRVAAPAREASLRGSESAGQESVGLESVGLDWAALMAELDAAEGTVLERELALWRPGHDPLPVQLTASRLRDGSGRPSGYLFALRDLGQIRRLERELRRHERLSALGNLAAGLAHEIRNPLSSIRGYATYLADRLDADPLGHAAALTLMEETERLNRVLSDLLGLARPRSLNRERASLARLLERAVRVAMPDADARQVRLSFTAPPGDALCDVDADRLMQAVLNLVINAIQATEAGGTVTLALGRDAGGWHISVRDTGAGMTAPVLGQVFTPYYTTKAGGTGLGLSISRQIVEQHGGTITASSVPGKGTTMTIVLPDDSAAPADGRKQS